MKGLSERLLAVAGEIINQEAVADIGADHGQLSQYLIKKQLVPKVIMVELNPGPYEKSVLALQAMTPKERSQIEVRLGDGLRVIQRNEVSTVIAAGLGGETIVEILSFDWKKASSYQRFVFQPMSRWEVLRREVAAQGWKIVKEQVIRDKKQFYVIITAEPGGSPYILEDLALEIGPLVLGPTEKNRDYLQYRRQQYRQIYDRLRRSENMETSKLLQVYKDRITELEAIIYGGKNTQDH